jgi:transposase
LRIQRRSLRKTQLAAKSFSQTRFLNTIEEQVPAGKVIPAIVDNYATHKHPKIRQWLARHPRWTFHFTPTSASWLNAVEGFFAKLTRRRLKRGVFRSVVKSPSTASSPKQTPIPNPSCGPPIQSASSPLSNAGNKR